MKVPSVYTSNGNMKALKDYLKEIINSYLAGSDYELQTLETDKDNNILVEIDRLGIVDIDYCAALNHYIVAELDKVAGEVAGADNYSLEVGSVSITAPFKSKIQYNKNLGHEVEIQANGQRIHGLLVSVDEDTFSVDVEQKVSVEGKKRKQKQTETLTYKYDEADYVKYDMKF